MPSTRFLMLRRSWARLEARTEADAAVAGATRPASSHAHAGGIITPGEAAPIAAAVDTFVRAMATSDLECRLRLVEADDFNQPDEVAGMNGAGAGGYHHSL